MKTAEFDIFTAEDFKDKEVFFQEMRKKMAIVKGLGVIAQADPALAKEFSYLNSTYNRLSFDLSDTDGNRIGDFIAKGYIVDHTGKTVTGDELFGLTYPYEDDEEYVLERRLGMIGINDTDPDHESVLPFDTGLPTTLGYVRSLSGLLVLRATIHSDPSADLNPDLNIAIL